MTNSSRSSREDFYTLPLVESQETQNSTVRTYYTYIHTYKHIYIIIHTPLLIKIIPSYYAYYIYQLQFFYFIFKLRDPAKLNGLSTSLQ